MERQEIFEKWQITQKKKLPLDWFFFGGKRSLRPAVIAIANKCVTKIKGYKNNPYQGSLVLAREDNRPLFPETFFYRRHFLYLHFGHWKMLKKICWINHNSGSLVNYVGKGKELFELMVSDGDDLNHPQRSRDRATHRTNTSAEMV